MDTKTDKSVMGGVTIKKNPKQQKSQLKAFSNGSEESLTSEMINN